MRSYVTPLTVLLYLLPIALALAVRARRERPAWQVALDVPMVVALDQLLVLSLARFTTVEKAVLASRPIWLLATAIWAIAARRRGERIRWPRVLAWRELGAVAVAAWLAMKLSKEMSRPFMMWDREWHIPLTSSLRGQKIPFHNVFEIGQALHYHVTGNILAAELQVLSGNILNATFALSLAHDVFFGLTAAAIGLSLVHFAPRRRGMIMLGGIAILLVGPFTLRGGVGDLALGYNFHNFVSLSFRPHVPIAGLMLVGIVLAVLARLQPAALGSPPASATLPALILCTAVLGVTDESATALVGLALGCAWLVDPNAVAPGRLRGLAGLIGLGVVFIGANLVFSAALAPGGPLQHATLVPWRNPGFQNPELPLESSASSIGILAMDVFPFVACLVGLWLIGLARPWRSRRVLSLLVFVSTICVVSIVVLTGVEINERADNVQRFMVAPMFVTPLLALLLLDRMHRGSLASALVLLGLASGAFSTVLWMRERAPGQAPPPSLYNPPGDDLYDVDCRRAAGAHFFERSSLAYVEASHYYLYAGCRPVYLPGSRRFWDILMYTDTTLVGFAQVDKEAGDDSLRVVCATKSDSGAVCPRITDRSRCRPEGDAFVSCPLTPSERAKILSSP